MHGNMKVMFMCVTHSDILMSLVLITVTKFTEECALWCSILFNVLLTVHRDISTREPTGCTIYFKFMLTGCWQDRSCLQPVSITHDIYQLLYIQSSTSWCGVVVKALHYKPAGRGFDSRCCRWNFSVTYSFWLHYGPGVDTASNRNEYKVYFLGLKVVGA